MKAAATSFIGIIGLFIALAGQSAHALDVGQNGPCVVLNHIQPSGADSEHCIRDPNVEGQFKIVEFFSAVCSDCNRNRPIVFRLFQEIGREVTFRFVGIDRNEALIRNYVASNRAEIPFEVALDTSREAARAYGVVATPTLFVLNPENKIVYKHQGVLSSSDLRAIKAITGVR